MAITFVSPSVLATGNPTTSFTCTLGTTAAGDILILEYGHRGTADATIGGTYSGPAFTEKHDQQFATSTFSGKTLWSRCTGNHSGQTITGSGLTDSCAAVVTTYRGALASGDPLTAATIVGSQNASGTETQTQITTTADGAWVVLVVVNSPDLAVTTQSCTSPGALTARAEKLSTGGTDFSIAHASAEKATAGATGAFTWAQTNAASGSWAYAIKPFVNEALAGTAPLAFTPTGTLSGLGALAGIATLAFSLAGDASPPGSASEPGQLPAYTLLEPAAPSGAMSGTAALSFTPTAALSANGSLAGTAPLSFALTATGSRALEAAGNATLAFAPTATIFGTAPLRAPRRWRSARPAR